MKNAALLLRVSTDIQDIDSQKEALLPVAKSMGYNVSEEWLRNGEGEMFRPTPSSALEQLAKDYNLSNAASKIIEKFVTLKPEKRKELLDLFLEIAKVLEESDIDTSTPAIPENQFPNFSQDSLIETIRQNVPKTPEELEKRFPPVEPRSNTNTG